MEQVKSVLDIRWRTAASPLFWYSRVQHDFSPTPTPRAAPMSTAAARIGLPFPSSARAGPSIATRRSGRTTATSSPKMPPSGPLCCPYPHWLSLTETCPSQLGVVPVPSMALSPSPRPARRRASSSCTDPGGAEPPKQPRHRQDEDHLLTFVRPGHRPRPTAWTTSQRGHYQPSRRRQLAAGSMASPLTPA